MYLPKKWDIKQIDSTLVEKLSAALNINRITAGVMVSRGMTNIGQAEKFLNPSLDYLYDPYLLPDMEKCVSRIKKAIHNREKILIYGDRDVDGITATVIMTEALTDLGADCGYFVPMEEAYGMQKEVIDKYSSQGGRLIVTVDCGIKNIEEIEYAKKMGIETIITDHHETADAIPGAMALVNPKVKASKYPFREIAGCIVAFKVCQAVNSTFENGRRKEFIDKYIDLMALGSIADIVPLKDENRVIVSYGLKPLANTGRLGLRLLIESCMNATEVTELSSKDVSWKIVPPLNASGRMGNAVLSCELMRSRDRIQAEKLVDQIIILNNKRKSSQEKSLKIISSIIHEQCNVVDDKVLVIASDEIDKRIAGVIASHIMQEYHRPIVVLRVEDREVVGSARSIEAFDIGEALNSCGDLLTKFGGHKFAAGLSMREDSIELFRKRINEYADSMLTKEDLAPKIAVDQIVRSDQIDEKLFSEINKLEPFGYYNQPPVFAMYGVELEKNNTAGYNKEHLRVKLKNSKFEGFGWGLGILNRELHKVNRVDMIFSLDTTVWDDRKIPRLVIYDLKPAF